MIWIEVPIPAFKAKCFYVFHQHRPHLKPLCLPLKLHRQACCQARHRLRRRRHGPPQRRPHRHQPRHARLKHNKPVLKKTLKTAQPYWTKPNQIEAQNPLFDLIIATDVIYIEETVGPLMSAMEVLVGDCGAMLLGYQIRSPEAHRLFWEICGRVFVVEKVPREHLHLEYAYEEADVNVLRKKKLL